MLRIINKDSAKTMQEFMISTDPVRFALEKMFLSGDMKKMGPEALTVYSAIKTIPFESHELFSIHDIEKRTGLNTVNVITSLQILVEFGYATIHQDTFFLH